MLFETYDPYGQNGSPRVDGQNWSSLGQEYLINDAGDVSPVHGSASSGGAAHGSVNVPNKVQTPEPTLVGSAGGFQIDLIWDSSVAGAPSGFTQAIVAAAQYLTTLFSDKEVINIDVGYGEIAGARLASNALGESESYGYLTNFATIASALQSDNYLPVTATNEPTTAQFFLTSAETKTMGLINAYSTAVDGFIALSSAYPMNYSTSGPVAGSNQFDAMAIAAHELTEVMGRIGMEGQIINGKPTYTPLDLFNYASQGVLELSANGGYFSVNGGTTSLGVYNNAAANGGDIADWTSSTAPTGSTYDAYNAFTWPGYVGVVSANDIIEDAALGYKLTPVGVAAA